MNQDEPNTSEQSPASHLSPDSVAAPGAPAPGVPALPRTPSSHTNARSRVPPLAPATHSILRLATALAHALERETDRALALTGLTATGFAALDEIRSAAPSTQRDLARRLGLRPSTTSELLRRLARRGWVTRTAHPALTPAGAAALERADRIVARLESRWARRMAEARPAGFPSMRFQALRRWLGEGLAALGEA
jgi:DNA-binding MarR family transcriptional regulator